MPTWLVALPGEAVALERRLRLRHLPVIARIENDRVVLDLRTVAPEEEGESTEAAREAVFGRVGTD